MNIQHDWLNIVRTKIMRKYPKAKVLFSRSSLVGRIDVVRRKPHYRTLKIYENGHTIDTVRSNPPEDYQIDPRVPHTLMQDPVILILGLSGDGITKTAKALSTQVYGVEINPAMVRLQTRELAAFNAKSYEDIDVTVMDGRSFLAQNDRKYDIITLMNAHFARGRTVGRAPNPEYLHTREALESYLRHLTERGVLIVEEPVNRPRREPPVWKLLVTMRQVLLDRGSPRPAEHFFIFQWNTRRNNYIQIVMKKNPFTKEELAKLKQWTQDVDDIKTIEARLGRRMGPIRTAKTTILYTPGVPFATNYARLLNGQVTPEFLRARNLRVTTDDRPFPFDVDPAHPESKASYRRTLLMAQLLWPLLVPFLLRYRSELRRALPYMCIVSLTGLGYFFVEMVCIQQYEIFLASPVLTFSTVLGTLLIFSGLGSFWSGSMTQHALYIVLGVIIVLLLGQLWLIPWLLPWAAWLPLFAKVILVIAALAPLAFFLGAPPARATVSARHSGPAGCGRRPG